MRRASRCVPVASRWRGERGAPVGMGERPLARKGVLPADAKDMTIVMFKT